MGQCLQDAGVNMKGNFPGSGENTFAHRLRRGNIRFTGEGSFYDWGDSPYVINTDSVQNDKRRSLIACLDDKV